MRRALSPEVVARHRVGGEAIAQEAGADGEAVGGDAVADAAADMPLRGDARGAQGGDRLVQRGDRHHVVGVAVN